MHQFWLLACVWNPTFPVAFRNLYNSGTEEIRSRIEFKLQFMHISSEKMKYQPLSLRVILTWPCNLLIRTL